MSDQLSNENLEEIGARWENNWCPDCQGDCYATTAYDDVRALLAENKRLRDDLTAAVRNWIEPALESLNDIASALKVSA